MIVNFMKPIVKPEFESYNVASTTITINVGIRTNNTNVENTTLKRDWFLKDIEGATIKSGYVDVEIGSYSTSITLTNLTLNTPYFFEIVNNNFDKGTATIFTGNITNVEVVNEHRIFQSTVTVKGDLIFDRESRKVKLPYSWSLDRRLGNGIIFSEDKYYFFCPSLIFTSNPKSPEAIQYTPFQGVDARRVPVIIMSDIKSLGNQSFSITPPAKLEVVLDNVSYMIDEKVDFLDAKKLSPKYSKIEIYVRYSI